MLQYYSFCELSLVSLLIRLTFNKYNVCKNCFPLIVIKKLGSGGHGKVDSV